MPDSARLLRTLDATWTAAEVVERDGWVLRRGEGGGNRVSAASGFGDVDVAVAGMAEWGQIPLFQLAPGQDDLDAELAGRGYAMHEPVVFHAALSEKLQGTQSHMALSYRCHCRPAIMEEIWANGGVGPARLAIMERVAGPKQLLMSRAGDRPCAVAFVAADGDVAMIHAIEVLPEFRRRGTATLLLECAARWASEQGAHWLTLAVTRANTGARALYERLGMAEAGTYHYRILKGETT